MDHKKHHGRTQLINMSGARVLLLCGVSECTIELKYMERYVQPEVLSRDFRFEPSLSSR
jgi:hypothetical protein